MNQGLIILREVDFVHTTNRLVQSLRSHSGALSIIWTTLLVLQDEAVGLYNQHQFCQSHSSITTCREDTKKTPNYK